MHTFFGLDDEVDPLKNTEYYYNNNPKKIMDVTKKCMDIFHEMLKFRCVDISENDIKNYGIDYEIENYKIKFMTRKEFLNKFDLVSTYYNTDCMVSEE